MEENPHPCHESTLAVEYSQRDSTSPHLVSGGLIRLQARLTDLTMRPQRAPLCPAWATLCGVVASGGFSWQGADWLRLALLILLVDGGWGTLWTALGSTDWATPLRRWRNWRSGEPIPAPPYTLPGSPGDRASDWLGQLRAWWRDVLWPACGPALSAIAVALPVTVVLGALLGPELLLLSAAALAVMQLDLMWERGRGTVAPGWDAFITVALAWLAGHIAFGPLTLNSAGLALAFALAWGTAWQAESRWGPDGADTQHPPHPRTLGVGAQFLAAALLVALHHPLAAGAVMLLLVPQLALLPWLRRGQPASWYVRHTRPWLMAAMLIAAWTL